MKTIRLVLPLLAAAALSACDRRPVQPRFDIAALDTLIGTPEWGCQVDYRFATIDNAAATPALSAIEKANIGYFYQLDDFDGTPAEAAAASLRQIADEMQLSERPEPALAWNPGEISVESEGSVVDTLVNYTIYRSSYTGGAHGMYAVEYHTYSLADGAELTAADLFGEERLQPLAAQIRRKIYAAYDAANDEELAAQGFFPEYIGVTDNFRIAPDSVVFFFNPYEVGCYALGPIEVPFSRQEIEELR